MTTNAHTLTAKDLIGADWFKSSYSGNGNNCVEVAILTAEDLIGADWFKSSYSGNGQNCLEVANDFPGVIPVRDSKDPDGPALIFPAGDWSSFVSAVKRGQFSV
ncbi:DUF397 domain-containing protein [Streptomyces sp. NPDC002446]